MKASLGLHRSRRARRGAALVEAALVIPAMLIFLGLTLYVFRSHSAKIAQQNDTSNRALSFASHACEGEPEGGANMEPSGDRLSVDPQLESMKNNGGLPGRRVGNTEREINMAKVRDRQVIANTAIVDGKRKSLFRADVNTTSEVMCNEELYENMWMAIWGKMGEFARGGGKGIF